MFEVALISGGRNWADSSHVAVWKIFAALKSSESCHYLFSTEILGNSDNSTFFFCLYHCHRGSSCEFYGPELWPEWQRFFLPPPVLFLSDAGHALRLRGAVQEDSWPGVRAAGHDQQLRVKEAAAIQRQHSEPPKAASLDESTVDFCCSWTSSDTSCTLHDRITNTAHVVWVEGGFRGNSCYLLTCFINYCYFQCSFLHENICGSQISTWLINTIQDEVLIFILI